MKRILTMAFNVFLCGLLSCYTSEPPDDEGKIKRWEKISALDGLDIWDVKIYNDEIFIAGRDINNRGVIYKSSDAINWQAVNTSVGDSLDRGVGAIDFYNGNLIAAFTGKPVYLVTTECVTPLTEPILNDVREMIVDRENNILIGTIGNYYCTYFNSGSEFKVYDSLFVPPSEYGCFKQSAIVEIGITKFLLNENSDNILLGNYYSNHFVTAFFNKSINCIETGGLSFYDKLLGCQDIIFINDTLFAAGYSSIKYLDQNEWKVYADTLPKTPDGVHTIATSMAYDEVMKEIYVAANYIGVLKWVKSLGWVKLNDGLQSFQGFYDFIPDIIYFKHILLLTYGTSKNYKSSSRGAMYYSIN